MRKETAFILAFLAFTTGTAAVIWMFAIPNFRPVVFPRVTSGVVAVGPMRHTRTLTDQEAATVDAWLQHHKSGWGPLSQTPPSSGDARVTLQGTRDGKPAALVLTLWTGISSADWTDTVFVESPDGTSVRSESFPDKEFAPLRALVDGAAYQHSAFP